MWVEKREGRFKMMLVKRGIGTVILLAILVGLVVVLAQPAEAAESAAGGADIVSQGVSLVLGALALLGAGWSVRYHQGRTWR
jgi:branched-subunit amino acid permease